MTGDEFFELENKYYHAYSYVVQQLKKYCNIPANSYDERLLEHNNNTVSIYYNYHSYGYEYDDKIDITKEKFNAILIDDIKTIKEIEEKERIVKEKLEEEKRKKEKEQKAIEEKKKKEKRYKQFLKMKEEFEGGCK